MVDAGKQSAFAAVALPGQVGRIASRLDRGEFEVALRHRDLDEYLDRVSAIVGRLATAILASSFIVGLAIIGVAEEPPGWGIIAPVWFVGGVIAVAGLVARFVMLGRRRIRH
jgi:hypothetical protein